MKYSLVRALREQNYKTSAKQKDFTSRKNISRICSENLLKLMTSNSKNYLYPIKYQTRAVYGGRTWHYKKTKTKNTGLDEITSEVWKTRKYDDILLRLRNTVKKQNINTKLNERLNPSLLQGGQTKNHEELQRHKFYSCNYSSFLMPCFSTASFLKSRIFRNNQNRFWRNNSKVLIRSDNPSNHRSSKRKNIETAQFFVDFY